MEAFRTNAHGNHFLGNPHTLANFESAFWRSDISDAASYEQWTEEGSLSAAQRANARWKQLLADYEPPPSTTLSMPNCSTIWRDARPRCPTRSADRKGRSAGCRQVDQMGPGGKAKAY